MNISIRRRIHGSFSIFVGLFVISGIITIHTLNENDRLAKYVSIVSEPTQQKLDEFRTMLIESKMYATNWVFLRFNQEDKKALQKIHDQDYKKLKTELLSLAAHWKVHDNSRNLHELFIGFEALLSSEKKIMNSLQQFSSALG